MDGNTLVSIPDGLPSSLEELKINENEIHVINEDSFQGILKCYLIITMRVFNFMQTKLRSLIFWGRAYFPPHLDSINNIYFFHSYDTELCVGLIKNYKSDANWESQDESDLPHHDRHHESHC